MLVRVKLARDEHHSPLRNFHILKQLPFRTTFFTSRGASRPSREFDTEANDGIH